ncbi:MAG: hypothetical protein QHG99_04095 [Methanomicrobiales archaeon]|nr:hypothetical protein [Methanomicrobiales archaeon]
MICVHAAVALTAVYEISEDGRSAIGAVELEDAEDYFFFEVGLLGERIPANVQNITLISRDALCNPCNFSREGSVLEFQKGNYTLTYAREVRDNHFIAVFERPYDVEVILPSGLDVRNRLIGSISQGGVVTEEEGHLSIRWNNTRMAECRFYEPFREVLLMTFFTFLGVVAVVLFVPFLLTGRRRD